MSFVVSTPPPCFLPAPPTAPAESVWYVYLARCADGTLYAGITNHLARRLAAHNAGTASRYTRVRRPVAFVWTEPHPDRAAATRRENALKKMPRAARLALIATSGGSPDRSAAADATPPVKPPA